MITLRHLTTGERQFVKNLDGIDLEVWEETGEPVPADLAAQAYRPDASDQLAAAPRRRFTPIEFLQLLTPAEVVAIDTFPVETANGQLLRYAARVAQAVEQINLDSPEMGAFLTLAQQLGVLTPARAARVFAGLPPL